MKTKPKPEWTLSFNRCQWALPIFIAWMVHKSGIVISMNILCFSVTYERWEP